MRIQPVKVVHKILLGSWDGVKQLAERPPICFREKEMAEYIDHLHRVGVEINTIAKDFNSGYGTEAQLDRLVELLKEVYAHVYKVRKMGFPKAT